jgi:hypothetical protein
MKGPLFLLAIIPILLIPTVHASSNSELFNEEGYLLSQRDRPAINEDFKPDYSCLFDVYQEKCIPGSAQECPKPYFSNNEDYTCFPKTLINGTYPYVNGTYEWRCPVGYHTVDEDETGQCYSNEEECPEWAVLQKAQGGRDWSDSCIEYKVQCEYNEDHPLCNGKERTDGIKVCDQPDHPGFKYCNDNNKKDTLLLYDPDIECPEKLPAPPECARQVLL